jgi:preprotein translocase subunit SecE
MTTLFWIIIAIVVAAAIYWIADWKKQHPNGE